MSSPRVSVVLPVRDEERYVEQAVRSILEQTYSDLELLVIDDGSTDGTGDVLARLAAQDERLRVLGHDRSGLVAAAYFEKKSALFRDLAYLYRQQGLRRSSVVMQVVATAYAPWQLRNVVRLATLLGDNSAQALWEYEFL